MKHVVYLEDVLHLLDEYIRVYEVLGMKDVSDRIVLCRNAVKHRIPIRASIDDAAT